MNQIIRDLVTGKMNVRKWILWAIAIAMIIPIVLSLWSACFAVISVSKAIHDDPERVLPNSQTNVSQCEK